MQRAHTDAVPVARYLALAPGASLEALALAVTRFASLVERALADLDLTSEAVALLARLDADGPSRLGAHHAEARVVDDLVEHGLAALRRTETGRLELEITRQGGRALARARDRLRTLERALDEIADPRELAAIALRLRTFTDATDDPRP
ncbi:hypothetical protein [Sandaracinus amylolyticus]|uniref:HTH marR-type domain-containing protein n=1 Tax=Sandaracinus amylolyticus TaxID=927083 RepID=A0A0F6YFC0_9BACT|nr:hypothetical protein [Sandaracinus amylolyticus]AKF03438.1 hypothetical protein DB32_000587 [Sandaracinus amylolyticus]